MSKKTPSRRKVLLINPQFQLRFMASFAGVAAVTVFVFYAAKLVFFHSVRSYMNSVGIPPDHMVFEFLMKQSRVMDMIFLAAATIEILFLTAAGLFLSHRVAGPFYRMTQDMLGMAQGAPVRPIKFRKKDYFQEVAEAFNKQMERQISQRDDEGKKTG